MTTAVANPNDLQLKKFIVYSIMFHALLALSTAVATYIQYHSRGSEWGGPGGAMGGTKVTLVASAPIPLPHEAVVRPESKTADLTKSLYKEEKKPPEPKTEATKIPAFKKEPTPPKTHRSVRDEIKNPPPDNAIPAGTGGSPPLSTGLAQAHNDESAGFAVAPGAGGADFATRFGWYIEAAKSRIYGNWQQWTIDTAARNSSSIICSITFTINRDGSLKDIHISKPSGNSSYDNSAYRAVLSSTPLGKLPPDYSGTYVTATLDFNPPGIR